MTALPFSILAPCVVCGAGMSHQPEHAAWCARVAAFNGSLNIDRAREYVEVGRTTLEQCRLCDTKGLGPSQMTGAQVQCRHPVFQPIDL